MADKIGSKIIVMKYSAFKENFISNDLIQSIDFAFHYNQADAKMAVTKYESHGVVFFVLFFLHNRLLFACENISRGLHILIVVKNFRQSLMSLIDCF